MPTDSDYLPPTDLPMQSWTANFLTVADAILAQIGLIAGDLAPITAAKAAFDAALLDVTAKEAAYKAAVVSKNTRRKSLDDSVRPVVRKIQATPGVPNSVKANLKITVRDTNPTPAVPVPPMGLVARGLDTGTNTLAWARSTNRVGTQFVIEAKVNAAASWSLVDVVTVTRYEHKNQQPGVPVVYRIRARRGQVSSDPSNEASVYAE